MASTKKRVYSNHTQTIKTGSESSTALKNWTTPEKSEACLRAHRVFTLQSPHGSAAAGIVDANPSPAGVFWLCSDITPELSCGATGSRNNTPSVDRGERALTWNVSWPLREFSRRCLPSEPMADPQERQRDLLVLRDQPESHHPCRGTAYRIDRD